jgi:hypothetical protein
MTEPFADLSSRKEGVVSGGWLERPIMGILHQEPISTYSKSSATTYTL